MRKSCAPPHRTDAPWGADPTITAAATSTSSVSYMAPPVLPRASPILPRAQHKWSDGKCDTRTTMQESFQGLAGGGPMASCKPARTFSPTPWPMVLTTTASESYIPVYGTCKRTPFTPKHSPPDGHDVPFTMRSTQQDAFAPWPTTYQRTAAIYPKQRARLNEDTVDMRTTQQDSFTSPPTKYQRALPFYPKPAERVEGQSESSTTASRSYVTYPRESYLPPVGDDNPFKRPAHVARMCPPTM